jgi:putative DNA primase/helicase
MNDDIDLIRYVQKALGYALTGDTREQCLFILCGTGANGKTTLMTAVAAAVGDYSQHTPTETLLVKRNETIPNDVARLHGARLVTAAEAECNRQLAEALVKQLTGGDKITARFLHKEFFEFIPTFKFFLGVNHKPVIKGTDHAIWRRIRLIPFNVTIPTAEQDRLLPAKLEAERAGILRWMVEGCLAWQQEGLEPPGAVTNATEDYRERMDTVGAFIDECCIQDSELKTASRGLYEAYTKWSEMHGETPMNPSDFGARLGERGLTPYRTKTERGWCGLGLDLGVLVTG